MKKLTCLPALFTSLLLVSTLANGGVITSSGPTLGGENPSFPGLGLTTGAGGRWNNISFSFYDFQGGARAAGELFVLTSAYGGTPTGLNNSTPGYLTKSISAVGGAWEFAPAITLASNSQYWFYVDEQFSWSATSGAGGTNFSGQACFATSAIDNYSCSDANTGGQWDFTLNGASVPEPSALALLGLGLLGLGLTRRRQLNV